MNEQRVTKRRYRSGERRRRGPEDLKTREGGFARRRPQAGMPAVVIGGIEPEPERALAPGSALFALVAEDLFRMRVRTGVFGRPAPRGR